SSPAWPPSEPPSRPPTTASWNWTPRRSSRCELRTRASIGHIHPCGRVRMPSRVVLSYGQLSADSDSRGPRSCESEGGNRPMGALLDLSFSRFIAPTIAKIVYVLAMIGIAITYVVFVVTAFQ